MKGTSKLLGTVIIFLSISAVVVSCSNTPSGSQIEFEKTGMYESYNRNNDFYFIKVAEIDSSAFIDIALKHPPFKVANPNNKSIYAVKGAYVFFYLENPPSDLVAEDLNQAFNFVKNTNPVATVRMMMNPDGKVDAEYMEGYSQ